MDRPALQMSGRLSDVRPCRIVHFRMDAARLKAAAARWGATVTAYLLAQMFLAGKAATDEIQGEMSIQVPVNMRKFCPSEMVRNFALYGGIRLGVEEIGAFAPLVAEISRQLEEKTSREAMSKMLTATEKLVTMLQYIPLAVKQPAARLIYGFLGDGIFSNTLSNLGVVRLPPALGEQVESMDFVLGTAITNRAECALVTIHNTATLSITKLTADPSFEEKLYALLGGDDIPVRVEGSELYES